MRIHSVHVLSFFQVGSGTNRDRHLSRHMNHTFWHLRKCHFLTAQEESELHKTEISRLLCSGPIFKAPRDPPRRSTFFVSSLRTTWQKLYPFFFFFLSGSRFLLVSWSYCSPICHKKKTVHKTISSFCFRMWLAARIHEGKFVGMAII